MRPPTPWVWWVVLVRMIQTGCVLKGYLKGNCSSTEGEAEPGLAVEAETKWVWAGSHPRRGPVEVGMSKGGLVVPPVSSMGNPIDDGLCSERGAQRVVGRRWTAQWLWVGVTTPHMNLRDSWVAHLEPCAKHWR